MDNNSPLLTIDNITFSRTIKSSLFGNTKTDILNNITFNLDHGKTIGILGESGSGKTTLLFLIQGLLV